jgi:hypothetical protein
LDLKTPEATAWVGSGEKTHFLSNTHEQSVAVVKRAYELGMTDVHTTNEPFDYFGAMVVNGIVGTLPADKDKRTKVFAWYAGLEHVIEHPDFAHQSDLGQLYLIIEFKAD